MCVLFGVGCNGLPLFAVVCLLCFAFVWAVVRTLIVVCPNATYVFLFFVSVFCGEERRLFFWGRGHCCFVFCHDSLIFSHDTCVFKTTQPQWATSALSQRRLYGE